MLVRTALKSLDASTTVLHVYSAKSKGIRAAQNVVCTILLSLFYERSGQLVTAIAASSGTGQADSNFGELAAFLVGGLSAGKADG